MTDDPVVPRQALAIAHEYLERANASLEADRPEFAALVEEACTDVEALRDMAEADRESYAADWQRDAASERPSD